MSKTKMRILFSALFIIIFLSAPIVVGKARISIKQKSFQQAKFKGVVKNFRGPADSIIVNMESYVIADLGGPNASKSAYFTIHPENNGTFNFELATSKEPVRVMFFMKVPNDAKGRVTGVASDSYGYLVESGDNINMEVTYVDSIGNVELKFSGKGAEKYSCMAEMKAEMNKEEQKIQKITSSSFQRKNYDYLFSSDFINTSIQGYQAGLKVLNAYKKSISTTSYDIMNADIYGAAFGSLILCYQGPLGDTRYPVEIRSKIPDFYSTIIIPPLNPQHVVDRDNNYALSIQYKYWYLINDRITRLLPSTGTISYSFPDLFNSILQDKGFSTLLKDKLLAECLLLPNVMRLAKLDQQGYDSCLEKAITVVKTPFIKDYLLTSNRTKRGASAFNFALSDPKGRTVHLSDFAGKVVLQDTWFTGCGGCIGFHHLFETEVYPQFKDNPDFVVVSVNSDKKKETWLNSMSTNQYTNPSYVNLYTNGLGDDAPIYTYYNSNMAPFLLLIDRQGKIYTRLYDNDPKEIIQNIEEALKKK
ncbi:TlpA disulfide reductase family protein [Chitinophaga sp. CC14]|uniref:TlpA family protein disulfide reductase n=1 Tax=Chitinophaga sp. CC14 TaxID=3029199 RepID=UPI003B7E9B1C